MSEFVFCTWSLHGKAIDDLSALWEGLVRYPGIVCLQELGGVKGCTASVALQECHLGPLYKMYVCSATEDVGSSVLRKTSLPAGLFLAYCMSEPSKAHCMSSLPLIANV